MTIQELNRDIKRLAKRANEIKPMAAYFDLVEKEIKPEIRRLYYADSEFKYMSKASMCILLRLNLTHRAIPLHHFGLSITI